MNGGPGAKAEDTLLIDICVIYAPPPPALPLRMAVQVPTGATVADALLAAQIIVDIYREQVGEIQVCVFGERCESTRLLNNGDRVELLRPLLRSPTEQRRARYARTRLESGG